MVLCIGQNYAAHAAESGAAPPATPIIFYKAPNTVVGPYDDVRVPRGAPTTDWEVELAVVIGRRARYLESPAQSLATSPATWSPTTCPSATSSCATPAASGPRGSPVRRSTRSARGWSPPDEIADVQALGLRSWVNGEPRQDSRTGDMIFDVAYLIWHLSQYTVLDPGDVSTPVRRQGVALSGRFPYLRPGDVVEVESTAWAGSGSP